MSNIKKNQRDNIPGADMSPYNKTFFDSIEKANSIGQKLGKWTARGGWKIVAVILTGLAIVAFGGLTLIKSIGYGMVIEIKRKK